MTWQPKLERAKRHFAELETALASFFAITPYKISTRRNDERKLVYYLSDVAVVPVDFSLVTGDVIQNLRSALDHLAYDLWLNEANGQGRGDRVYFPIDKDEASYKKNKSGKTQGISAQSLAVIDSLRPYAGGNNTLWRIHALNNLDKHRLLVTVGSSFQSMDLGAYMLANMRTMPGLPEGMRANLPDLPLFLKPADNLFPLAAGAELFIGSEEDKENPDMQFRFNIVLEEPGIVEGEPVTDILSAMIAEVGRVGPLFKV
ncbi:MAG TPA: hypothetical protein VK802_28855 [Streptosporangiaceae bacterium]|jgi:hypothetical protein|nr:hypothetical protein [Streptosporangiaceae bacterium]